ncbi:hypothetical protein B0H11DRAFT_2249456 [Mycena galericulata]|nr:hypothetical protein B0H11DRAFT_2249456 [Mycena galericulata]
MSQPTYGIDLLYATPPEVQPRIPAYPPDTQLPPDLALPAIPRHAAELADYPLTPPQVRSLYFLDHPSVSMLFLLCTDPSRLKSFPKTALSALFKHASTALQAHHDSEQYIPRTTLSDNVCCTLSRAIKTVRPARKDWHKSFQDHGDSDPVPLSFKMPMFPPPPCADIIPFDYETPEDLTAFALLDSPSMRILLQHLHAPPPTSYTLEPLQDVYTRTKDQLIAFCRKYRGERDQRPTTTIFLQRLRQRIKETDLQPDDLSTSFLLDDSIPPGNPALPRTFAFPITAQIQPAARPHIPLHSQGRPQSVSPPSTPPPRGKNHPSPPPPQTATTIRIDSSPTRTTVPPDPPARPSRASTRTTVPPDPPARPTRASTRTTIPPEQPARPTRASTRTNTVPPEPPARPTRASTRTNTAPPQPPPTASRPSTRQQQKRPSSRPAPSAPPSPKRKRVLPPTPPLPPTNPCSPSPTILQIEAAHQFASMFALADAMAFRAQERIARATEDLINAIDEYVAEHDTLPDTTQMPPELACLFRAASPAPHAGPSTFPGAYTRGSDDGSA